RVSRRRATKRKKVATINAMPPVSTSAVVPAHSTPPLANTAVSAPYKIDTRTKNAATNSNNLASMCMGPLLARYLGELAAPRVERMRLDRHRRLVDRLQRLGVGLATDPLLQIRLEVVGRHHPNLEVHHRVVGAAQFGAPAD